MKNKSEKKIESLKAQITSFELDKDVKLEEDLDLINELAKETLTLADVFIFELEPSNSNVDLYFTKQGDDTLQNFVDDINENGVALLGSHKDHEYSIGRLYKAWLEKDGDIRRLKARAYILRDDEGPEISTNSIIRKILGGIIKDISAGFRPGWWQCSICEREMFMMGFFRMEWKGEEGCDHIPGEVYNGELCHAIDRDGHLNEASLVYKGACPEALINKVKELFKRKLIPKSKVIAIEQRLQTNILSKPKSKRKEQNMPEEVKLEGLSLGKEVDAKLDEADSPKDQVEVINQTFTDKEKQVKKLEKEKKELETDAEIGKAQREAVKDEIMKLGVSVQGDKFDKDKMEKAVENMPYESAKEYKNSLKEMKEEKFKKEDRETEGDEKPEGKPKKGKKEEKKSSPTGDDAYKS